MLGSSRSRSPQPPLPRVPSPILTSQPRPSTSSNRSLRRTGADFEAALLNPQTTVFLSGSPVLDEGDEGTFISRVDDDAPHPIEKRLYEEELNGMGSISAGSGVGLGVIPPTPSTKSPGDVDGPYARRESYATTVSVESGGSTPQRTSSGRKMGPSLGLDAELNEGRKTTITKKRSIFRSPGTASSPDLATLVRKAKEARSAPLPPQPNLAPPVQAVPNTQANPPPPPRPHARVSQSSYSTGISSQTYATGSRNRDRAVSQVIGKDEWDGTSVISGTDMRSSSSGMSTIHEGRRSRQNSTDDGFKTMRSKAKGVFGRMFGSSSKDNQSPVSSPKSNASPRQGESRVFPRPPVPPVPAQYAAHVDARKKPTSPTPPDDVFGSPISVPLPRNTPKEIQEERLASPLPQENGPSSATPTEKVKRRVSGTSVLSMDKPLPTPPGDPGPSTAAAPRRSVSSSMHVRQPANIEEDSPPSQRNPMTPIGDSSRAVSHSPARVLAMKTFSDDVNGMLDGIGQTDPAKELGLPPESLRQKSRTNSVKRFPVDLARSISTEPPRMGESGLLSPGGVPMPSQRTSSLPTTSPRKELGRSPSSANGARSTSSPRPPDTSLAVQPTSLSRSSTTSSRRRKRTEDRQAGLSGTPLGSPLLISQEINDFGPPLLETNGDVTVKPKTSLQLEAPLPPLSPQSVRLVSSPRPETPKSDSALNITSEQISKSSFGLNGNGPWGKQSQSPSRGVMGSRSVSGEIPDDEERGRKLACEFLEGDEASMQVDKVAEFLGGPRAVNRVALRYYMQYFDMKGQTLVEAFRDLCGKLHLKAESQEIDRIIEAFSARYFECNPTTIFGSPGVVHTTTAAMLMLNTDLHIADLNKHMTRSDFVRNALRAVAESLSMESGLNANGSTPDLIKDDGSKFGESSTSVALGKRSASASVTAPGQGQGLTRVESSTFGMESSMSKGSTTTMGSFVYTKAWESDAENALKDIYNQVRADKILLPIGEKLSNNRQSMMSVSSGGVKGMRSPSDRVTALKRGSVRVQGLTINGPYPYQSGYTTSDGRLSPTPSFSTGTSDNTQSFSQPTIGFASNLSHSVIKEEHYERERVGPEGSTSALSMDSVSSTDDMDDDELALLGAPWAKEGLIWRRAGGSGDVGAGVGIGGVSGSRTLGRSGKKGEWKQYFAVISKGEFYIFTFGEGSSRLRVGGAVGGGNWLNNAKPLGHWMLMHSTSSAVPTGPTQTRDHVFALSSPNGEINLFQAGTEELVGEWVSSCNYWAARKSRQPLQGGVGNIEYGWNRAVPNPEMYNKEVKKGGDVGSVRSGKSGMSKVGFGSASYRRGNGVGGGNYNGNGVMDKVHLHEWKAPVAATLASPLDEESQLEVLCVYVRSLCEELDAHKAIERPMLDMYTTGSKNAIRAHSNWVAKTRYLVHEIFKYETYVEGLRNAVSLRVKKQGERRLEKSLGRSMTSLHRRESEDGGWEGEYNEDEFVYESKAAAAANGRSIANGVGNGMGLRNTRGLTLDDGRGGGEMDGGDGEEEEPITPLAGTPMTARTRGVVR